MSNSNNYNQYPDSDDEDTNSVEHIYTEKNTSEVHNNRPPQSFTFGGSSSIPTTVAGAFGQPVAAAQHVAAQPASATSGFGGFGQSVAAAQHASASFGGFGLHSQPSQPASASFGGFGLHSQPAQSATTVAGGFSGLGGMGFGFRAERHPETGLPMGCNLRPPQGVCGGNRNPTNTSEILNSQSSNKQKIIDELYKKLANARAQIQNINKSIDDIYEIIPKIS